MAGAAGGAIDVLRPDPSAAQTPKRGGVFRFPGFDPPHFDPHQTPHWWTFIFTSLTHGGLVRLKAGPSVQPGTMPIEPHLAESWEPYVKNFMPNIGNDYGGRLMSAWLDR